MFCNPNTIRSSAYILCSRIPNEPVIIIYFLQIKSVETGKDGARISRESDGDVG